MSEKQDDHFSLNVLPIPWWVALCRLLWKILASLSVTVFLGLIVNVLSTWLIGAQGSMPSNSPLTLLLIYWLVTLLCFLCLSALVWSLGRWKVPTPGGRSISMMQARTHLLRCLRLRYEQLLAQSLEGVVQLELALSFRSGAIQNHMSLSLHLPDQPDFLLPPHSSLFDAYTHAHQELLLLGDPGAGKSTMLLKLAYQLLLQAEQDTIQPLPILLPLSSWATNRQPLEVWLTEQIALFYSLSRTVSRHAVQEYLFLPLLDGLDEVETSARPACIAAINAYHRASLGPLVFCSRTQEYDQVTSEERLALDTAVVIILLTKEPVDTYLLSIGKPVTGLRSALRKHTDLQNLVRAPLLLQILILTYHGTSVRALAQKDVQLRRQIWADYSGQMIERKGDNSRYPFSCTVCWLIWLARQMRIHNQTVFYLGSLQTDWLPVNRALWYRWSAKLPFGLLIGLALALLFLFATHQIGGISAGFIGGMALGCIGEDTNVKLVSILTWSWAKLKDGFIGGLFFGIVFSLLLWFFEPVYGLWNGVFFGLLGGYVGHASIERLVNRPTVPSFLSHGLSLLLFFGLVSGFSIGAYFGLPNGLVGGLICALFVGLVSLVIPLGCEMVAGFCWRERRLYRGGVIGALAGFLVGILAGLTSDMFHGLIFGATFGVFFGLVSWMGLDVQLQPTEFSPWVRKLRQGLFAGVLIGVFSVTVIHEFRGILFGLLLGDLFVILTGVSGKELPPQLILTPNEGVQRSVRNTLLLMFSLGGVSGVLIGLLLGGIVTGFYFGMISCLMIGVVTGFSAFVQYYILRFWLWQTKSFPWNVVSFLDDACARILLRRVGGGYSFVHHLLLDFFADQDEKGKDCIKQCKRKSKNLHRVRNKMMFDVQGILKKHQHVVRYLHSP